MTGLKSVVVCFDAEPIFWPGFERQRLHLKRAGLPCCDQRSRNCELVNAAITVHLKLPVRIPIRPLHSLGDIPQFNFAFLPTPVSADTQLESQGIAVVDEQLGARSSREFRR